MMNKIASTSKILRELNVKTVKDLTLFYCKTDTIFSTNALLKLQKESNETFGLDHFHCISSRGYSCDSNLFESKQEVKNIRD